MQRSRLAVRPDVVPRNLRAGFSDKGRVTDLVPRQPLATFSMMVSSREVALSPLYDELAGLAWDVAVFATPTPPPPPPPLRKGELWLAARRAGGRPLPPAPGSKRWEGADVHLLRVLHSRRTYFVAVVKLPSDRPVGDMRRQGWVSWPDASACPAGRRPALEATRRAEWIRQCRLTAEQATATRRSVGALTGRERLQALMESSRQRVAHAELRSWNEPRNEVVLTRTLGASRVALRVPLLNVLGSQAREPVARLGHLPAQEPELRAGQAVGSRQPARSTRSELARCRACGQPLSDPQSAARGWGLSAGRNSYDGTLGSGSGWSRYL